MGVNGCADSSGITVYCDKEIGVVDKKVLGNNFIGYDPMTYEDWAQSYYGYSDYGAGVWNPDKKTSVKEVINLAKEAGISIVRFPGGCGTHHYNWKNAVGQQRQHFLYGIDEFLESCEDIGAEAVITMSYFTGDEKDAADLVEYLNLSNDGNNFNGGLDWAQQRSKNGRDLPYGLKYFEIGNEIYHGDHRHVKKVLPQEYAMRYLKYYEAMKAVDPTIKIGVVLYREEWNRRVLEIVKDKVDFGIMHAYPTPAWGKDLEPMEADDIFRESLGIHIINYGVYFQSGLALLRENAGFDVPLAITEYNGGFLQDKPLPYRHCLGNALLNAELLRIFMRPENGIFMANYWQFCNSYWGMVKSREDFMKHDYQYPINYVKRPNYYVFELYNNHFGFNLLDVEVESDSYAVGGVSVPYLSVNASKDEDNKKVYLMVVNKNLKENVLATVRLKGFSPSGRGKAWILNGSRIDSMNEDNPENVGVVYKEFDIRGNSFRFVFQRHSLTALEIVALLQNTQKVSFPRKRESRNY
jgi:alpha-N-arabinofuranosidase